MLLQSLNENRRAQSQPQLSYSNDALRNDLIRVREAWRESRRRHDRYSVYKYLTAVFDLVTVWEAENRAIERAKRALSLKRRAGGDNIEPFAAVIRCTSSRKKVDAKARSKWARALIFAAEYKMPAEPLEHFIRRHGGINLCAAIGGWNEKDRISPDTQCQDRPPTPGGRRPAHRHCGGRCSTGANYPRRHSKYEVRY
jgi:hypothetical protein